MNNVSLVTLLAVIYHESGRPSVAAGSTLAHSLGQGRPFTEFNGLRHEARLGREITAAHLLERFQFCALGYRTERHVLDVETLARGIHECERHSIEAGMVAVVLDPPRPWIDFDALPEQAQTGRRNQAKYLLERFAVLSA